MVHTDEFIKKDVVEELIRDDCVDASKIAVEVNSGIVTLRGEVPTDFAKSSAFEDTKGVIGVKDVKNMLMVQNPSEILMASDSEKENTVMEKLASRPGLRNKLKSLKN